MTTFPMFAMLPKELRDSIWDLAIRDPNRQGVHYFTVLGWDAYDIPEDQNYCEDNWGHIQRQSAN
jgi:hypothetical protein